MFVDEITDPAGKKQHEHQRDDDRRDHYAQILRHADGCNDGVEREHDVQQQNLHDDRDEFGGDSSGDLTVLAFKLVVDFVGAFP